MPKHLLRRPKWASIPVLIVLLLQMSMLGHRWERVVVINTTDSLPRGLYLRVNQPIEVGTLVEFEPPPMALDYATERWGQKPDRVRFLKPVVAGPGDVISHSRSGEWLLVNGHPLAPILHRDSDGNTLACYWKDHSPRVLCRDEILVISMHSPGSYDSRYFGPVSTADGADLVVRRPLLLW